MFRLVRRFDLTAKCDKRADGLVFELEGGRGTCTGFEGRR